MSVRSSKGNWVRKAITGKRKKFAIICISVTLAMCIVLGIYGYLWYSHNQKVLRDKKCQNLFSKENEAFQKSDWDNTINYNESILQTCSPKDYQKVTIEQDLAISYYFKNDKDKAKQHANNGLALNNAISPEDRAKIKDQYSAINAMNDISSGSYVGVTTYKEIDSNADKEAKR